MSKGIFESHRLLDESAQVLKGTQLGQQLSPEDRKALGEILMLGDLLRTYAMQLLVMDDVRQACPLRRSAKALGKEAVH